MYRAPPKVKFVMIECDEIWVENTSKMGDSDKKCLPRLTRAFPIFKQLCLRKSAKSKPDVPSYSPCMNNGKKAMKNTKKMDMIQCLIQSNTGMRL